MPRRFVPLITEPVELAAVLAAPFHGLLVCDRGRPADFEDAAAGVDDLSLWQMVAGRRLHPIRHGYADTHGDPVLTALLTVGCLAQQVVIIRAVFCAACEQWDAAVAGRFRQICETLEASVGQAHRAVGPVASALTRTRRPGPPPAAFGITGPNAHTALVRVGRQIARAPWSVHAEVGPAFFAGLVDLLCQCRAEHDAATVAADRQAAPYGQAEARAAAAAQVNNVITFVAGSGSLVPAARTVNYQDRSAVDGLPARDGPSDLSAAAIADRPMWESGDGVLSFRGERKRYGNSAGIQRSIWDLFQVRGWPPSVTLPPAVMGGRRLSDLIYNSNRSLGTVPFRLHGTGDGATIRWTVS